jgi:hypothetical protein
MFVLVKSETHFKCTVFETAVATGHFGFNSRRGIVFVLVFSQNRLIYPLAQKPVNLSSFRFEAENALAFGKSLEGTKRPFAASKTVSAF